jgi:hypothetical protein
MTRRKPMGWLGAGLAETWHTLDFLAEVKRRSALYAQGAVSGRVNAIC